MDSYHNKQMLEMRTDGFGTEGWWIGLLKDDSDYVISNVTFAEELDLSKIQNWNFYLSSSLQSEAWLIR